MKKGIWAIALLSIWSLPLFAGQWNWPNIKCKSKDGRQLATISFLLQGRVLEVMDVTDQAKYVGPAIARETDINSPYKGYLIYKLTTFFNSDSSSLRVAFDRIFPARTPYQAVVFLQHEDHREILHEWICED